MLGTATGLTGSVTGPIKPSNYYVLELRDEFSTPFQQLPTLELLAPSMGDCNVLYNRNARTLSGLKGRPVWVELPEDIESILGIMGCQSNTARDK